MEKEKDNESAAFDLHPNCMNLLPAPRPARELDSLFGGDFAAWPFRETGTLFRRSCYG